MGRILGINVKMLASCGYCDGHVKDQYEMSMAFIAIYHDVSGFDGSYNLVLSLSGYR